MLWVTFQEEDVLVVESHCYQFEDKSFVPDSVKGFGCIQEYSNGVSFSVELQCLFFSDTCHLRDSFQARSEVKLVVGEEFIVVNVVVKSGAHKQTFKKLLITESRLMGR